MSPARVARSSTLRFTTALTVVVFGVAVSACEPTASQRPAARAPSPSTTASPTPSLAPSPEPVVTTPAAPAPPPAPPKVDCTPPTATVIEFRVTSRDVPDVAHDTVEIMYGAPSMTVRYTNRSVNAIDVDWVTGIVTWRTVPHVDRRIDWASPYKLDTHVNGSSAPPQRLEHGQSEEEVINLMDGNPIRTAGGGLKAVATLGWEFVDDKVDAVCRLGPLRTMRVGAVRDDAPFQILRTRRRTGATLADVKLCVGTGSEWVMNVTPLWAVTVGGRRVNVSGSENPLAKAAGAGRLKVPVPAGGCRTITVAFLTKERVAFIQAPGYQGPPWRWRL